MSTSPATLARQWFQTAWNDKDRAAMREMLAPDLKGNTEGGPIEGAEQFIASVYEPLAAALPDVQIVIDGVISEGNEAAVRWTAEGTHAGPVFGIPASQRKIRFSGMTWLRFENGKIIEGWDRYNLGGLLACFQSGCSCETVCTVD